MASSATAGRPAASARGENLRPASERTFAGFLMPPDAMPFPVAGQEEKVWSYWQALNPHLTHYK